MSKKSHYIPYSKEDRIRYHRKRRFDWEDSPAIQKASSDEISKSYANNKKVQYSTYFLHGVFRHRVKNLRIKRFAERRGYYAGYRASKKPDGKAW